jgi:hypothetical protein
MYKSLQVQRVAELINLRCAEQGAKEGSNTQQADNETLSHDGKRARGYIAWCCTFCETKEEVVHKDDVRNLASVIAKNEAACASVLRVGKGILKHAGEHVPMDASKASIIATHPMGRPWLREGLL